MSELTPETLTVEQVDALTGDDMAYWLGNRFMTPDLMAEKVCWWVSKALADMTRQRDALQEESDAADVLIAEWQRTVNLTERELADLRTRIEALAHKWASWPNTNDANGPNDYARALRALVSPTDLCRTPIQGFYGADTYCCRPKDHDGDHYQLVDSLASPTDPTKEGDHE